MLTDINPRLPMRNKDVTRAYYSNKLGFKEFGSVDYDGYLMMEKDRIQIHFFMFKELDPKENYGQVYIRTNNIKTVYQSFLDNKVHIHPNGQLEIKSWGQKEFSVLDPDNNLLTFGQGIKGKWKYANEQPYLYYIKLVIFIDGVGYSFLFGQSIFQIHSFV